MNLNALPTHDLEAMLLHGKNAELSGAAIRQGVEAELENRKTAIESAFQRDSVNSLIADLRFDLKQAREEIRDLEDEVNVLTAEIGELERQIKKFKVAKTSC
jgi:septal ring factor EnvC (AmiA/AmiB activator)